MIVLERRLKGETRDYCIYDTNDALDREAMRHLGIEAVPWRESREGGWALSDDGYVSEVVSRKVYTNKLGIERIFFVVPFARVWSTKRRKLLFEEYQKTGAFYLTTPRPGAVGEARRGRTKRAIMVYLHRLFTKGTLTSEDWHEIGNIYRPGEAIPEATARRLFKNKHVQQQVMETIREIFQGEGIDERYVIQQYQKVFNRAFERNQLATAKSVVDAFRDLLAMTPSTTTEETEEREYVSSSIATDRVKGAIERRRRIVEHSPSLDKPVPSRRLPSHDEEA